MIESSTVGNKLLGFYRGQVIEHLPHGYCKIYIPSVYPKEWKDDPKLIPPAEQASSLFAGTNTGSGVFTYPNIGSIVWCFFANNDQNYPIYFASSLGGENAFGQYEMTLNKQSISYKDENGNDEISTKYISDRHVIASGKTHIEWYENGKLSVQVEDPDRRDANVDYKNTYIGQISDDAVSSRPICEKVQAEELSNIHCKLVFDNDNNTYGSISAQTHHFDLLKSDISNMTLTNDNDFILDNNGHIKLQELSTYTFISAVNALCNVNNNVFSMSVPGESEWSNELLSSVLNAGTLTSNITANNSVVHSTSGKYSVDVNNTTEVILTADPLLTRKVCTNTFNINIPGNSALENHLTSTINSSSIPLDYLESDISIATTTDGSISHNVEYLKNQETSDKNVILITTELAKQQSIDSGFKQEMHYSHFNKDAKISIKNDLTSDTLANDAMNATKTFRMTSVGTATSPVNVEFNDNFDALGATIERSVNNNLATIYDFDKVDAINSTHTIKLQDKATGNTSYVTMNTKDGALSISMEGSGHCTVVMKSNGTMTIDTSDKMTVTTTSAVDVSTQKITMNGSQQIDLISPTINIGTDAATINIGNSGKTATTIGGSSGDCYINKVSLVNHTHLVPPHCPSTGKTNPPTQA